MLGALPLCWTRGGIHRLKEEVNFRLIDIIVAATEGLFKGIWIYIWNFNEESFILLIRHSCFIENHSVAEPPPKSASQVRFFPNEVRPYKP